MAVAGTHERPVPEEPVAVRSAEIVELFRDVVLNAVTTEAESVPVLTKPFRWFLLYVYVESSGTPTTVQFEVRFRNAWGGRWHVYKQGLFASLFYEDQDAASGIAECFQGAVGGREFSLRIVGTGTSASDTFTVSAAVEFYA